MADGKSVVQKHPVAVFFTITFVYSWFIWIGGYALPGTGAGKNANQIWSVPGAWGPLIAAALVLWITKGDLRAWAAQAGKWRVRPRWYLVALGLPVFLKTAAPLVLGLVGAPLFIGIPDDLVMNFLVVFFIAGSLEEFGWRGFALPRLQTTYGAFGASLIIGVAWAVWHFPFYFMYPAVHMEIVRAFLFLLRVIPEAIIITWLYNSTSGSVLLCMIFHAVYDSVSVLGSPAAFQFPWGPEIYLSVFIEPIMWWLAALIVIGVYGKRHLARTPGPDAVAVGNETISK